MGELITSKDVINHYGLQFNPDYSCQANGLINALKIAITEPEETLFPRIYQMPMSNRPYDVHAYLIWGELVLNGGVTGNHGQYPDFGLRQIYSTGEDMTKIILSLAVVAFFGSKVILTKTDKQSQAIKHFRLAIDETFSELKHSQVIACLIYGYKQVTGL